MRLRDRRVTTVAGAPRRAGFVDGAATGLTGARFNYPSGLALAADGGVLYIADQARGGS